MSEHTVQILKSSRLCQNMKETEIERLLADHHSRVKVFQKGERLFEETDRPEKIWLLLSGSVMIAKDTLSGKRMLIAQIDRPGEMFGEVYAFMGQPAYDMYAEALEKTEILTLDNTIFWDKEAGAPELIEAIQNNIMAIFAQKAYMMNRRLRILGGAGMKEKIARFLVERQDREGNIKSNLSREEMADYLNVTRPSLSRELGSMAKDGILKMEGRTIEILDQEAFEQYL